MVELTGTGGATYHVNGRWGYVHALIGPMLLLWVRAAPSTPLLGPPYGPPGE